MTNQTRATAIEAAHDEYNGICENDSWAHGKPSGVRSWRLRCARLAATRTSEITGHTIEAFIDDEGNAQFR